VKLRSRALDLQRISNISIMPFSQQVTEHNFFQTNTLTVSLISPSPQIMVLCLVAPNTTHGKCCAQLWYTHLLNFNPDLNHITQTHNSHHQPSKYRHPFKPFQIASRGSSSHEKADPGLTADASAGTRGAKIPCKGI
jgi:hypothetical protein